MSYFDIPKHPISSIICIILGAILGIYLAITMVGKITDETPVECERVGIGGD